MQTLLPATFLASLFWSFLCPYVAPSGYPPTAIGYPPTAIGYSPTAIGYPPTAILAILAISAYWTLRVFFFFIMAPPELRDMWSPHPNNGTEHHTYWNSCTRDMFVVGAMWARTTNTLR